MTLQETATRATRKGNTMAKVMVRSTNAGVFYGKLVARDGDTVTMKNSRRVWYWAGAATLSELANSGTKAPGECKFPAPIKGRHTILGVCEIIEMTPEAVGSLDAVPVWSAS